MELNVDSIRELIKPKLESSDDGAKSEEVDEDLILFISFDLVNSTQFKNFNNFWLGALNDITKRIRAGMGAIDNNFQLWRVIGDELIFTIAIKNENILGDLIQGVFELLYRVYMELKNGEIFKSLEKYEVNQVINQNIISIKSTAWIALVADQRKNSKSNLKNMTNVKYQYEPTFKNEVGLREIVEFQGNDIDAGFRVAKKCAESRRLTISVELAYILAKSKYINPKINIVGYKSLKGIWNGAPYPVIWYHDEYIYGSSFNKSFFYDEKLGNKLLEDYFEKKHEEFNDSIRLLEKIVQDRNLGCKIEKIVNKIRVNDGKRSDKVLEKAPETVEVHCVAVCVDEDEKKVLIAKRADGNGDFGGLWEFGCAKMVPGRNFKEILKQNYKQNFNVDIEIENPFIDYEFERKNKKVPGIRYWAKIIKKDEIQPLSERYSECKLVNYDEFIKINDTDFIAFNEFKDIMTMVRDGRKY